MKTSQRNIGFTIMELLVTIALMVVISMFIHQIFFFTSDAVKLGIATSDVMKKAAAIQNQLTFDTKNDLMLGPATADDPVGGFLVIVNHEIPAYIRDPQADKDAEDSQYPDRAKGLHVIKKFRSDQLIFIRKKSKGEVPISPPNKDFYGNIDDGKEGGYMKIWYGHLERTLPDGNKSGGRPDQFGRTFDEAGEPNSPLRTGYNGLANEWILGRQAMHLYPTQGDLPPGREVFSIGTPAGVKDFDSAWELHHKYGPVFGGNVSEGLFYPSNPAATSSELSGAVVRGSNVKIFPFEARDGMSHYGIVIDLNKGRKQNLGFNYVGVNDVALDTFMADPYVEYILDSGKSYRIPAYGMPLSRWYPTWGTYGISSKYYYGQQALECGYVEENLMAKEHTRLWVNPMPQDSLDEDDQNSIASMSTLQIAQQHAYLSGNVSDFIVEFAADTNNDGFVDRDPATNNIQWYGMTRRVGQLSQLSNRGVYPPDFDNDYDPSNWKPASDDPLGMTTLAFKYPRIQLPHNNAAYQRREAYVFRHDDGAPFIKAKDGRNSIWPYMIRIRYRIQDPRGRLQTESEVVRWDNPTVLLSDEPEPGKWFEKIIRLNRPRNDR